MIYITYTMAAWDFADIYTRSPRALGVYISKIPRSHGITIKYTPVQYSTLVLVCFSSKELELNLVLVQQFYSSSSTLELN